MSEPLVTSPATPAFQKLVAKLREVFQIDQPDLDFGIYRIINARAAEIGDYLENQLRAKVDASLATGQQAGLDDLKRDLAAAEQQARDLGVSSDSSPKVKELRARITALSGGAAEHRDAVFCEGGRLHGERHCMELESVAHQDPTGLYWPRLSLQREEGPEHTKAVMCRTREFKYVRRLYEADELYDLRADPRELCNVAGDAAYAPMLARMKERLLTFFLETGDVVPFDTDRRS